MLARDVERYIRNTESQSEQQLMALDLTMLEKQREILALTNQQAEIYRQMADVLLSESPDVSGGNNGHIQTLLLRLKKDTDDLAVKQQYLQANLSTCQGLLEQLSEKVTVLETERDKVLFDDPNVVSLSEQIATTQGSVEQAEQTYHSNIDEFKAKLAEYRLDGRYNYLLKRKFGHPEYAGRWIFRNLDSWLARQVNFPRNFNNEKMLLALLDESDLRLNNVKQSYEDLILQRDKCVALQEDKIGLTALYEQATKLQSDISSLEEKLHTASQSLQDNQAGESSLYKEVSQKIAEAMSQLPIAQLNELALKTNSTLDDHLLKGLAQSRDEIKYKEDEFKRQSSSYSQAKANVAGLKNLREQFEVNGMGQSRFEYLLTPTLLTSLIDELIGARSTPDSLLRQLEKSQKMVEMIFESVTTTVSYRRAPSGYSGGSRSSGRSSSSSSSGGFSTRSSTGGGGFRTTDSF